MWGMDIQIYDESGNRVGECSDFSNPFCNFIHTSKEGVRNCREFVKRYLKPGNTPHKPFSCECYAGLYCIVVPVIVNSGKYVGSIIGTGMKLSKINGLDHRAQLTELSKAGLDVTVAEQYFEGLKSSNGHSQEDVIDFVELIARDVIIYYEMLQEQKIMREKRASLLDKIYSEKYKDLIGVSPAMKKVFRMLELIEKTEKTVLIQGETGTGKELLAAAIHYNSPRKDKVFIIQNCSAFNDALLTSELFGHEKGSFTGAVAEKDGLFQIADGGTLFLDEIGDMSLENQAKLLRILEHGTFSRVGGTRVLKTDVRIIAATNRKLDEMVGQGLFRKDLFYRLNTVPLFAPSLRNRKEDIIPLAFHFLDSHTKGQNGEIKDIDQDVFKMLVAYDWPGNVRELKNIVERLVIMSAQERTINADLLRKQLRINTCSEPVIKANGKGTKLKGILKYVEREIIEHTLLKAKWNKTITSRNLGISRASLNMKIEQYGILRGKIMVKTQ